MIKINTILMSLGIVVVLILSTVNSTSVTTTTTPPTSNPLGFDPYPQLEVVKKVWNPTTLQWAETINANVGDTVRFNITVKYYDYDANDACRLLTKIHIVDHLGNFEFKDNVACYLKYPSINPNDFMTFNSGTNVLIWDFNSAVVLSETSGYLPSVFSLEFNAKVNSPGSFTNYVEVNGTESCCGRWGYSNASAFVYVRAPDNPAVNLTKYVKEGNNWVKDTTVNICDNVQFKIRYREHRKCPLNQCTCHR